MTTALTRLFRDYWRMLRGKEPVGDCDHAWDEKDFRRHCPKCDEHQMLYENRYPDVGAAKYEWH